MPEVATYFETATVKATEIIDLCILVKVYIQIYAYQTWRYYLLLFKSYGRCKTVIMAQRGMWLLYITFFLPKSALMRTRGCDVIYLIYLTVERGIGLYPNINDDIRAERSNACCHPVPDDFYGNRTDSRTTCPGRDGVFGVRLQFEKIFLKVNETDVAYYILFAYYTDFIQFMDLAG